VKSLESRFQKQVKLIYKLQDVQKTKIGVDRIQDLQKMLKQKNIVLK